LLVILCTQSSPGTEAPRRKDLTAGRGAPAKIESTAGPVWQLDVRALGFANPHRPESSRGPFPHDPVSYLAGGQIVVTFVTRVAPEGVPRRDQPDESLPFRLHALFIDAATGKVRTEREWPTASARSCVLPSPGGKFLVFTPDKLLLYSPSLELLQELSLPLRRKANWETWELHPSPAGKYLLISYDAKSNERFAGTLRQARLPQDRDLIDRTFAQLELSEDLVDTEELSILGSWTVKLGFDDTHPPTSISDEGLLVLGEKAERFDSPWQPVPLFSRSLGFFINDQVLLALRSKPPRLLGFDLNNTRGDLLFKEDFPDNGEIMVDPVRHSAGGQRFALAFIKGKGGIAALDIAPHYSLKRIIVFDIPSLQWVYRLDGKRQRIKNISGLALSPDGSQLGLIDQNGILRAYRLSETPSAPPSRVAHTSRFWRCVRSRQVVHGQH